MQLDGRQVQGFGLSAVRSPSSSNTAVPIVIAGAAAGVGVVVLARSFDVPPLQAAIGGTLIGVGTAIGVALLLQPSKSTKHPTPFRPLLPRGPQIMSTPGSAIIHQSVLDQWIPFNTGKLKWTDADGNTKSSPNEGLKFPSYMYEDILGLMTTGMGNLIEIPDVQPTTNKQHAAGIGPGPSKSGTITDEGLNAGWVHTDGTPASGDEIRAEFARLKGLWGSGNWEDDGGFQQKGRDAATLWLPEAAVMKLISGKLQAFADSLKTQLPGWDNFPADAQTALLSHAWAAGSALGGWPKFKGFINQTPPDWHSAAGEGYVYGPNHSIIAAITPRNDSNVRLMLNAEGVEQGNMDPSVLYFPQSVGPKDIA